MEMGLVAWSDVEHEFRDSYGELPDITVLGTDLHCWQVFLDHCGTLGTSVKFTIDGTPSALPGTPLEAFAHRLADRVALLSISLDGLLLNTHFFGAEVIDMDMDPRELTENRFALLCEWILTIGRKLGRDVELTHEGGGTPILRFTAKDSTLSYIPVGGA